MSDIIFVDSDSTVVPEGSVLQGLAAKFDREGFTGQLWFVRGGHAAIVADGDIQLVSEDEVADAADTRPHPVAFNSDVLDVGKLPKLAFQRGSTTGSARPSRGTTVPATAGSTVRGDPFNLLAPPSEDSNRGTTPRSADSGRVRLQPANPFFDNIRQNLELAHGPNAERIPLALPEEVHRRVGELPKFLQDLVKLSDSESSELLAQQFYEIERSEQQRLQSVMDILSQDCTTVQQPDSTADTDTVICNENTQPYFPFSISAGVERGTKNRYKNIWPYDFSRVRLGTPGDDDSDYINASFVQPPGTTRRYIATQGPLDTTYRDFWTLVWEQQVHVIVMLTKQYEAGLLKCGKYWDTQQYGDLNLQMVSETGGDDNHQAPTGFNFEAPQQAGSANSAVLPNIKRTFKLWHNGQKDQPPRTITQIQCVEWPDWDVPDSPEVLLNLMRDVDKAVCEQSSFADATDRCDYPPVLVHCSAGVGRTGSYILVDAVADGLRREYRKTHDSVSSEASNLSTKLPVSGLKLDSPPPADGKPAHFLSPGILEGKPPIVASPADGAAPLSEAMEVDPDHHPQSLSALAEAIVEEPTDFKLHQPPAMNAALSDLDAPLPVTSSHVPHTVTRPLANLTEPIMDVLRAMRVQRMSLVQSLRQFIFAHRAVIAFYLCMLDEETQRSSSSDSSQFVHRNSSTGATSIASTDDESHVKRKPSETELQASGDLHLQSGGAGLFAIDSMRLGDGSPHLSKRLSFKKRRAASNGSSGDSASIPAVPRIVPGGWHPPS
ncbi:hypothetical protein Q8F55_002579 [Vanrija albida]|uniref:Protein-tyrosine-phosphatase n=1 Tax=Vanrija albida TaxID=181172 RepID=A0ABR3QA77_9TREE